ncbi:MAG TPA: hypothetical protein VEV38_13420 [Candidatus Eremiobacteraceae bacterium]|nr:hypothetical protein [Candidatus Eremiobacteraceae bacterium]
MKNGAALVVAAAIALIAAVEVAAPFAPLLHEWWLALIVTLGGAYVLVAGIAVLRTSEGRASGVACLGGALLAGSFAFASFLGGQPERVPAAPGQTYRPAHSAGVALVFPAVEAPTKAGILWPGTVSIQGPFGSQTAAPGQVVRAGAFVLKIDSGPIALVDARSANGQPVTVTQPNGADFLSPYLTFTGFDGDKPEDYFAVPAVHRNVQVDYWSGLPSRGIDVPFLVMRIGEENGGTLFEGVAVSGRPLKRAGLVLTFTLGQYPIVTASSAPPLLAFWAGVAMVVAGTLVQAIRTLGARA